MVTVKVQANASGAVITGIANFGNGSGLTGLPSGSEFSFGTTGITTTKNLGINTTTVDNYETLVLQIHLEVSILVMVHLSLMQD